MEETQPVVIGRAGENALKKRPGSHKTGLFSGKTRSLGRLPDFIAVGPPRTGTTWLDKVLRGHAALPEGVKETHFFRYRYWRGIDWYARHFRSDTDLPVGEIGPSYFAPDEVRGRIKDHIPDCKIICTFREPVSRLYSHYKMFRRIGLVKDTFERLAFTHRELNSYSQYGHHLRGWRDAFGRDNVLVLIHEDSYRDRQGYLDAVCSFIGIPPIQADAIPWIGEPVNTVERAPKNRKLARRAMWLRSRVADRAMYRTNELLTPLFDYCMGRGPEFPPLDPDLKSRVRAHLRPEVEQLEDLIQHDLSEWK
jgi:hypothetical protein